MWLMPGQQESMDLTLSVRKFTEDKAYLLSVKEELQSQDIPVEAEIPALCIDHYIVPTLAAPLCTARPSLLTIKRGKFPCWTSKSTR